MPMFVHKGSSKPQCKGLHEHVCKLSAVATAVNVMSQVGKLACLADHAMSNIVSELAPLGCCP